MRALPLVALALVLGGCVEVYEPLLCRPCAGGCGFGLECVQGTCVSPTDRCGLDESCPAGTESVLGECRPPCEEGLRRVGSACEGPVHFDVGRNHGCAVWSDGRVGCWGSNFAYKVGVVDQRFVGRPRLLEAPTDVVRVAAGYDHSCALTSAGAVWCWGGNFRGELGDGQLGGVAPEPRAVDLPDGFAAVDIVAGEVFSCVFDIERKMYCWGSNGESQLGLEALDPSTRFQAVGFAWGSACGAEGGEVLCWGQRSPTDAQTVQSAPSRVTGMSLTFDDVVCAVREDGALTCTTLQGAPATSFESTSDYTHLDGAGRHRCARDSDGKITCMNDRGEVIASPTEAVAAPDTFKVGHLSGCLSDGGPLRCWGSPGSALLGEAYYDQPLPVAPAVHDVAEVVAGGVATCARHRDGAVTCWGNDVTGTTGTGTIDVDRVPPTRVEGLIAEALDMSGEHVCALTAAGELWCWGSNGFGQVDPRVPGHVAAPRRISDLGVTRAVAAGRNHTCALDAEGQVRCWGQARDLGGGVAGAVVAGLPPVVAIDAGEHTCAIDGEGGVWCWGRNDWGQADGLGPSSPHQTRAPLKRIEGVEGAIDLALGDTHSCARLASGRVICWGGNQIGQSGLRGVSQRPIEPSFVLDLEDVVDLDAGPFHTCATRSSGRVVCWGEEQNRRLGAADEASVLAGATVVPRTVDVLGVERAIGVSAAHNHSCATLEDGTVRCWGVDGFGVVSGDVPSSRVLVTMPAPR